jgi:ribulose bisphosphate carboxylase small subunit
MKKKNDHLLQPFQSDIFNKPHLQEYTEYTFIDPIGGNFIIKRFEAQKPNNKPARHSDSNAGKKQII